MMHSLALRYYRNSRAEIAFDALDIANLRAWIAKLYLQFKLRQGVYGKQLYLMLYSF